MRKAEGRLPRMRSPVMPSTTELYTGPVKIEVLAQAPEDCGGKQNNRFSIDFDALGRVLANEGDDGQNDVESQPYSEIRRQDNYRFSAKSANLPKSRRIILYSPSFGSTFRATSFQELGIRRTDLPHVFSEDGEHLWWMDVQNPSEKELRLLCSAFRIHPLTVEDILNRETQEKIEDFTNYYFACFRSYHVTDTTYKPYTIYMVVFSTGTLSFCFSDSEHADHVLNRIELLKDYLPINSDWIFYAFVWVSLFYHGIICS
jgi:Mg2+ and Co2+ transporter CorA